MRLSFEASLCFSKLLFVLFFAVNVDVMLLSHEFLKSSHVNALESVQQGQPSLMPEMLIYRRPAQARAK